MTEIKKCPFCGSTDIKKESIMRYEKEVMRYMRCRDCLATGSRVYHTSELSAWNNRPVEEELQGKIDNLLELLGEYKNGKT